MADLTTEARDIERLTDVIVELTPGDRELAERIAGAVWRAEVEFKAEALRAAAEAITTHFADLAAMKRIGPVGVNDEYLAARARSTAFSDSLPPSKGYRELMFARDFLRDRAGALSASTDDGGTGRPERAPDGYKAALRGADGAGEAQGAHGMGNDEGDQE